MHSSELVDTLAGYIAIFVLVFVPALLIYVFWMIHILPEKIAERRGHPQAEAIKTLCLLSLAFGGLLWPIAWLWAYSRPVFHQMAYGTDRVEHPHGAAAPDATTTTTIAAAPGVTTTTTTTTAAAPDTPVAPPERAKHAHASREH
jgi:Protein of unknown function (DUF3302)